MNVCVCVLFPASGVLKAVEMFFLRLLVCRRRCSRPVLLLVVAICLYQTRGRFKSTTGNSNGSAETPEGRLNEILPRNQQSLFALLDALQNATDVEYFHSTQAGVLKKAVLLPGQHSASETEIQLYRRVFAQHGYLVSVSRFAEKGHIFKQETNEQNNVITWDILICLQSSETNCPKSEDFDKLKPHQKVNTIPWIKQTFFGNDGVCHLLDRLAELQIPVASSACGDHRVQPTDTSRTAKAGRFQTNAPQRPIMGHGVFAIVKVYVLVTSVTPLTAFFHSTGLVKSGLVKNSYATKLDMFFEKYLGTEASLQALENVKENLGKLLMAADLSSETSTMGPKTLKRCRLCFQLLIFTLGFNYSLVPTFLKVQDELDFEDLEDPGFDGQITKECILEDTLNFVLPSYSEIDRLHEAFQKRSTELGGKDDGCIQIQGLCLTSEDFELIIQYLRKLKTPGAFELLYPSASPKLQRLLKDISKRFHQKGETSVIQTNFFLTELLQTLYPVNLQSSIINSIWTTDPDNLRKVPFGVFEKTKQQLEKCTLPHIRQIYTYPPLELTPRFSPKIKDYYSEVPFDVVTVKIRAEPVDCRCQVHLEDRKGPRTANYPVGLGSSRINILVVNESQPEPVVMTIYTLNIYRENRPSLPIFDEYMMCGFLQDCGLVIQPEEPCGLETLPSSYLSLGSQGQVQACNSGDAKGRWIVPCLSCADNRTCDWREVSWQPENCYHPVLNKSQLQTCMEGKKVIFIGDSTNRGMMYYLMERVNETLEEWDKAHDTKLYHNVNGENTFLSYSYYPQFWLSKDQRPTFEKALEQLIQRSRPLENTDQTVLVVGGVQWLNTNHLQIIQKVLKRENLSSILVVMKSLGMGFHFPADGIRSLSLNGVKDLYSENTRILIAAKKCGYEVIDTFSITMGRYKEFLQGRCACHFHEVGKLTFSKTTIHRKMKLSTHSGKGFRSNSKLPGLQDFLSISNSPYHVKGPINQVYSEILLSRICMNKRRRTST
ncbi:cadherin-like and PC-esterase domain-containing protein 1 isoform X2 [Acipenser ruthenus]|uniref:cadherin-like and PC-esterase domain-containing protein 1 isoform X2 n=1 Tax=Acipenser ruthenus TaxID=7906 RepID=UPI00274114D4|nr:cadherin-like and PC-esterase domain-containing protein 1 isoform X2 [Acipenser ruthenus]